MQVDIDNTLVYPSTVMIGSFCYQNKNDDKIQKTTLFCKM